jgi:hypothetical protein
MGGGGGAVRLILAVVSLLLRRHDYDISASGADLAPLVFPRDAERLARKHAE